MSAAVRFGTPLALVALAPVVGAALVNLPQRMPIGAVSLMGALTIAQTLITLIALATLRTFPRRVLILSLPLLLYLAWLIMRSIFAPPGLEGAQNALVYFLFAATLLLTGTLAAHFPARMLHLFERALAILTITAFLVIVANFIAFGWPRGNWWVGARSAALIGLVALNWALVRWAEGDRHAFPGMLAWLVLIVMTTSRTASFIALVSIACIGLVLLRTNRGKALITLAVVVVAVLGFGLLLALSPVYRTRMLAGDASLYIGDVAINANGRIEYWATTVDAIRHHPIVGAGAGSSQEMISASFLNSDNVVHPHNDYLRVWHDLGLVGLLLLLLGPALWLPRLARSGYRRLLYGDSISAPVLLASLTLLQLLLAMFTDNILIYPFFMGAAGTIVGLALGLDVPRRRSAPAS